MQRGTSWRKVTGVVAAAGLMLTACGGGSSKLSGEDLASELDGACRTTTRAIDKLDPEDGADFYNDAADLLDTLSGDLGKLTVDDRDAGDVEDFASLVDDEVKVLKDVADAADAGDAAALAAAQAEPRGEERRGRRPRERPGHDEVRRRRSRSTDRHGRRPADRRPAVPRTRRRP